MSYQGRVAVVSMFIASEGVEQRRPQAAFVLRCKCGARSGPMYATLDGSGWKLVRKDVRDLQEVTGLDDGSLFALMPVCPKCQRGRPS